MNKNNTNNFDINLNGGATLAQTNAGKSKDYINLNCYIQRPGDEKPEWVFQASCVSTTRRATESIMKKIAEELAKNMKKEKHEDEVTGEITIVETEIAEPIAFTFIEGNLKQEKQEMEDLF